MSENFKSGFISIIGKPNVGKSTLMNKLMGETLSVTTPKAQTTRHRIMGIITEKDYQIVYSDTPGIIQPKYKLQEAMMGFVKTALEDADVILFVTDIFEKYDENDVLNRLKGLTTPIIVLINKIDLATQEVVLQKMEGWKTILQDLNVKAIIPISALHKFNLESIMELILAEIPIHPPYFPEDEMTDKSQRFFASEIIRGKIFEHYDKEIPYCCEVIIESFKESEDIIRISTTILVERETQKRILIGTGGEMLKRVGITSRREMEKFFGKQIYLEQYVKVEPEWRDKVSKLAGFGYLE